MIDDIFICSSLLFIKLHYFALFDTFFGSKWHCRKL